MTSLADRLLALHDLYLRGHLTEDEFADLKAREIERTVPAPVAPAGPPGPPTASGRVQSRKLNPVVPGVGLALGAASIGGLGG